MRKMIAILPVCGLLFLAGCQESSSIGIIGGADGPTAILVSSSASLWWIGALAAGIVAAVVFITVMLRRKRK